MAVIIVPVIRDSKSNNYQEIKYIQAKKNDMHSFKKLELNFVWVFLH